MSNYKNPTQEQQIAFAKMNHEGCLVMLNLLKFNSGNAEAYNKYLEAVAPLANQIGAEIIYSGKPLLTLIGPANEFDWDLMLMVSYSNKEA